MDRPENPPVTLKPTKADPICDICCRPRSRHIARDLQCPETAYFREILDARRPPLEPTQADNALVAFLARLDCAVVEVSEPHPYNPSPNIHPVPRTGLLAALRAQPPVDATDAEILDALNLATPNTDYARRTHPPKPEAIAGEGDAAHVATAICCDVAELPDRTSPDDWPEAMLVTHEELRGIVLQNLAALSASTDQGEVA